MSSFYFEMAGIDFGGFMHDAAIVYGLEFRPCEHNYVPSAYAGPIEWDGSVDQASTARQSTWFQMPSMNDLRRNLQ